jgi:hypothetical protein
MIRPILSVLFISALKIIFLFFYPARGHKYRANPPAMLGRMAKAMLFENSPFWIKETALIL